MFFMADERGLTCVDRVLDHVLPWRTDLDANMDSNYSCTSPWSKRIIALALLLSAIAIPILVRLFIDGRFCNVSLSDQVSQALLITAAVVPSVTATFYSMTLFAVRCINRGIC
jgi:hypothetical protein